MKIRVIRIQIKEYEAKPTDGSEGKTMELSYALASKSPEKFFEGTTNLITMDRID